MQARINNIILTLDGQIEQTMTETLADIMPKKPKGKARKARMPLDGS